MLAEIGENARFFALLLEALERALKVLVVMNYDFRQNLLPPFVAFVRRYMDRLNKLVPCYAAKQVKLTRYSPVTLDHSAIAAGTAS